MSGLAIVMFSDLVDSTVLLAQLGDDRMERIRRAHVLDVRGAVGAAGGHVIKTIGDGAMASFDSALGALRAAAGIQATVARLDAAEGGLGIAVRVGVAAGEPIAHEQDLHGMAVVISSRLCAVAAGGEVLVQDLVAALVASRDGIELEAARPYALKGIPMSVRASKLRWRGLTPSSADAERAPGGGEPAAPEQQAIVEARAARHGREHVPLPRALAAYAAELLVGRDREIALLREATSPRAGRHAVLLTGEPGIGKTRHAAAIATEAHERGALVVLARCPPETVISFEPWVRALGELARAGEDAWRSGFARAAGRELCALVPELAAHMPALSEQAEAGAIAAAEGARYRLLHGIGAALGHAAGEAPLHVVLDDAHWCDAASAQALRQLLDNPPVSRMVLVVTAREHEMGRRHPVSRALSELRRTGDLTEMRLEGLDAGGLATLVTARIGRAITPSLAARLRDRTAGNPFFAAELARDLHERGALGNDAEIEQSPAPDAVTDLVEERLARLDPSAERLLQAVAVIGPSAPIAMAARTASMSDEEAQRAIGQALAERLVDEVAAARPTVAFPHALVREALAAGTDGAARARLHLAAARALEQEVVETEPAELARHYGFAVAVTGPEPAIGAYRRAALAAAATHDHEQAAAHLRRVLALIPEDDLATRAPLLLDLGEQELLSADLIRARKTFQAAGDAARAVGDGVTLARAALGFAGGDIGFGWEFDDRAATVFLREGLDALGQEEPRLALRVVFRLVYSLVFTDDEHVLPPLVARAQALHEQLDDVESEVLARFTGLAAACARGPDPAVALDGFIEEAFALRELAERCDRDDLLFRMTHWTVVAHYAMGQIAECEQAIERAAEIARRLCSPRFSWEVELNRGFRLLDRGERRQGEALLLQAGTTIRRLRPDIHIIMELYVRLYVEWLYEGQTGLLRSTFVAMEGVVPSGILAAAVTFAAAIDGDHDTARQRMATQLVEGLAPLRRADVHIPLTLCMLATAATLSEDRTAGARLRPLLEPLRPHVIVGVPSIVFGHIVEWHIGRLELLAGRPAAAVPELRAAVSRADALQLVWLTAWTRVDLAIALHRCGDHDAARSVLADAEALAEGEGMRWAHERAMLARSEIEGRKPPPPSNDGGRTRALRALTSRTGRRALATMVRGQDDETIERRFCEPRRQRALLRAMTRSFQPAHAGGFQGLIAYELEPTAVPPPPEAPWRWAIQVDSAAGHARLREPAPLDAAVTVRLGLADWVRVVAGVESSIATAIAGRCGIEGDALLAARLEAMFGGE